MTKDEALRLAWDALEDIGDEWGFTSQRTVPKRKDAITAIKEALANEALEKMAENARELGLDYEPEQPKVRTGNCLRVGVCASEGHKIAPQRTWVGLTDEEKASFWIADQMTQKEWDELFVAIEAKLKEKNS
jgi:hypothetical protein